MLQRPRSRCPYRAERGLVHCTRRQDDETDRRCWGLASSSEAVRGARAMGAQRAAPRTACLASRRRALSKTRDGNRSGAAAQRPLGEQGCEECCCCRGGQAINKVRRTYAGRRWCLCCCQLAHPTCLLARASQSQPRARAGTHSLALGRAPGTCHQGSRGKQQQQPAARARNTQATRQTTPTPTPDPARPETQETQESVYRPRPQHTADPHAAQSKQQTA